MDEKYDNNEYLSPDSRDIDYATYLREKRRRERLRNAGAVVIPAPDMSRNRRHVKRYWDVPSGEGYPYPYPDPASNRNRTGSGGGGGGAGGVSGGSGTNVGGGKKKEEPFWLTGVFWKRASVVVSVLLSIASLILGAFVSLNPGDKDHLRFLSIGSLIVNSVSIGLSAATSLDWQKSTTHDKKFADMLGRIVHVHDDAGRIVILGANGSASLLDMGGFDGIDE